MNRKNAVEMVGGGVKVATLKPNLFCSLVCPNRDGYHCCYTGSIAPSSEGNEGTPLKNHDVEGIAHPVLSRLFIFSLSMQTSPSKIELLKWFLSYPNLFHQKGIQNGITTYKILSKPDRDPEHGSRVLRSQCHSTKNTREAAPPKVDFW